MVKLEIINSLVSQFKVITKKADNGNSYLRFVSLRKDTEDRSTNFTVEMLKSGSSDLVTRGSFILPGSVLASSDSFAIERNQHNIKLSTLSRNGFL